MSQQAKARAKHYAVEWVKETYPKLWEEMLDAAYEDFGIERNESAVQKAPTRKWTADA